MSNRPDAAALRQASRHCTLLIDHMVFGRDRRLPSSAPSGRPRSTPHRDRLPGRFHATSDPWFVNRWSGPAQHPPPYCPPSGSPTHERALAAGVKTTGSVHFVPPTWIQVRRLSKRRSVMPDDQPETLARVTEVEHKIYPQALRLVLRVALERLKQLIDPIVGFKSPKKNPRHKAGGSRSLMDHRAQPMRHETFRFSADVFPRIGHSSNSTFWLH